MWSKRKFGKRADAQTVGQWWNASFCEIQSVGDSQSHRFRPAER
ncbi:hypothetical protein RBSWK_04240 [Rhodopirellula baltica SWK14]|uniref:Uncharacterized protein n=1 Tax=Rhodopirellula baltica SWK14 TaxID=993516 RepID=L7CBZ2_RHOBT|nr:hypothetical protein RBSWK_04240 [Rhodopirellula baltica SWK14]